jgi:hypothetical protein
MPGIAIITEACIDVEDRACVDVCPVQCIYEFDPPKNILFSEVQAESGVIENTHLPNADSIAIFGDSLLYVNTDECTSCTAWYQPDVCRSERSTPRSWSPTGAHELATPRRRQQGPRSHLLHPTQPGRLRRLTRCGLPVRR